MVCACGVDSVLIGGDLPDFGTDLIAALASLDVDELTLDAFQLEIRVSMVSAGAVDFVLIWGGLPENGTGQIAALASDELTLESFHLEAGISMG